MMEENLVLSQEFEAPSYWTHWANGLDIDWWQGVEAGEPYIEGLLSVQWVNSRLALALGGAGVYVFGED